MKLFIIILLFFSIHISVSSQENNFFVEAKKLFDQEKFEESKFLFQRNIVYNPKDAKSYIYLAKIFKNENDESEEVKNLNTALLLEPRNEDAMYMLIDIEFKRSNFSKVKKLNDDFKKICSSLCENIISIERKLKEFEKKSKS